MGFFWSLLVLFSLSCINNLWYISLSVSQIMAHHVWSLEWDCIFLYFSCCFDLLLVLLICFFMQCFLVCSFLYLSFWKTACHIEFRSRKQHILWVYLTHVKAKSKTKQKNPKKQKDKEEKEKEEDEEINRQRNEIQTKHSCQKSSCLATRKQWHEIRTGSEEQKKKENIFVYWNETS